MFHVFNTCVWLLTFDVRHCGWWTLCVQLYLLYICIFVKKNIFIFKFINLKMLQMPNVAQSFVVQLTTSLPSTMVTLNCSDNQLTQLPDLPSTLVTLNCSYNRLTQLPSLPSTLVRLYCTWNQLTCLPDLPSTLVETLYCSGNQLTLPKTLIKRDCSGNAIM